MPTLGERIKELRTSKDLTQEEFGKLFGVVKSTVSLYESGKSTPDDTIKKKIASYFDVSLDYLMGLTNEKKSDNPLNKEPQSLEDFIEQAKSLMFYGEIVDENDKKAMLSALKAAYEVAIRKNKEKDKEGK